MSEEKYILVCIIAIFTIFLVGIFCIQYYFKQTKDECISDPFVYGAKQLEDQYDVKVNGLITFWGKSHLRMYFNSNETIVENDRNQKLFLPI